MRQMENTTLTSRAEISITHPELQKSFQELEEKSATEESVLESLELIWRAVNA